jgi:predicted dehydrogenase
MLPTFTRHPAVRLVAAADTRTEARKRFADEFSAKTYDTVAALCADAAVDAVYVATPHQFHREHATQAAEAGKHLLIEKPMALTVEDCAAIVEAARRAGVHVVVGHSHSFDTPVQHLRKLIESDAFGQVRMITALNYTDYLFRPRRPEELDTSKGGGAVFNQAAHQVDMVRLVAGAPVTGVRAVTGSWDANRPTEGALTQRSFSRMVPSHRWSTAAMAVSIQTNSRDGSARWARPRYHMPAKRARISGRRARRRHISVPATTAAPISVPPAKRPRISTSALYW